jgi:hypothetical protein
MADVSRRTVAAQCLRLSLWPEGWRPRERASVWLPSKAFHIPGSGIGPQEANASRHGSTQRRHRRRLPSIGAWVFCSRRAMCRMHSDSAAQHRPKLGCMLSFSVAVQLSHVSSSPSASSPAKM